MLSQNDNFNELVIVNQKELNELTNSNIEIENIIELNSKFLVSFLNKTKTLESNRDVNINIGIAAAVTAYARIHMSQFKNNPAQAFPNLYYSDTDSLYFDGPIDDSFISNSILGKLKLEGIYNKALFLAPKVYALENTFTGDKIIKIKGLTKESIIKNNITLDNLIPLLNSGEKSIYSQNKWFRNLNEANIQILEQVYTLKVTGNKRDLIYKNGKLVETKPILIQ